MSIPSWRALRRRSVPRFIREMLPKHPELADVVTWEDFTRMANREGIAVRVVAGLPRKARLVRFGAHVVVQVSRELTRADRTLWGMHELCHFWRDDPGVMCYHATDGDDESEDFANIFAWTVTSPARLHVPGIRPEDFTGSPDGGPV